MRSRWNLSRLAVPAAGLLAVTAIALVRVEPAAAQTNRPREVQGFAFSRVLGGTEIGVSIRDLDDADIARAKLPGPAGAYVATVRQGSPADEAGFKAGDIVVTFDGERVRSAAHLARLVGETPEGRSVQVEVRRDGSPATLTVAPRPARVELFGRGIPNLAVRLAPPDMIVEAFPSLTGGVPRLGVRVQGLPDQLGEYFGAASGVLVTSVDADTPAYAAGLKAGDIITKVGNWPASNVAELRRQLAGVSGDVTITVLRDRTERELKVALPDRRTPQRRPLATSA
jgi:serine protease Do